MTDVGVKYDRFLGRSVMGVRCSLLVRRASLRPRGICAPSCFRFEYRSCQVEKGGEGEDGSAGNSPKLLYAMAEVVTAES
jgi:hypothetical protein